MRRREAEHRAVLLRDPVPSKDGEEDLLADQLLDVELQLPALLAGLEVALRLSEGIGAGLSALLGEQLGGPDGGPDLVVQPVDHLDIVIGTGFALDHIDDEARQDHGGGHFIPVFDDPLGFGHKLRRYLPAHQ